MKRKGGGQGGRDRGKEGGGKPHGGNYSTKPSNNPFAGQSQLSKSRGLPGILITCERGNEGKARRDAKQIILHHLIKLTKTEEEPVAASSESSSSPAPAATPAPLSLDEEIALLKKEEKKPDQSSKCGHGGVDIHDTGMTGVLLAVFTKAERLRFKDGVRLEDGEDEDETDSAEDDNKLTTEGGSLGNANEINSDDVNGDEAPKSSKRRQEGPSQPRHIVTDVVSSILMSLLNGTEEGPRSRFVHRLVPLIATCYPSQAEITETGRIVIKEMERLASEREGVEAGKRFTFAIQLKKRMCDVSPEKEEIIKIIGGLVDDRKCGVDLTDPEYTIVIDIFKNLAG